MERTTVFPDDVDRVLMIMPSGRKMLVSFEDLISDELPRDPSVYVLNPSEEEYDV